MRVLPCALVGVNELHKRRLAGPGLSVDPKYAVISPEPGSEGFVLVNPLTRVTEGFGDQGEPYIKIGRIQGDQEV